VIGRFLLGLLAAFVLATPAAAHTRSQSYSSWIAQGKTLTGVFQVGAQRVTQLGEDATFDTLDALLASHLAQTVSVTQRGVVCPATAPRPLAAAQGDIRVELAFHCARALAESPTTVVIGAFFEVSPSHVHYARVARAGGQAQEVLATARSHKFAAGGSASVAPTDLAAFFRLGLGHVLSGIDHLAFILALALLAGGFGHAVWAATGFTLGHSLTLGLVAAGWLRPDVASVEALIGFTVAFAAGEAFSSRDGAGAHVGWATLALVAAIPLMARFAGVSALPWAVVIGIALFALCAGGLGGTTSRRLAPVLATAFGLAHGAGFASALLALDIPRERLLKALLGFNLGVEGAQLLALAAIAAVATACRRLPTAAQVRTMDYVSVALFALGVYWFAGRSLALA
jgi:hypothetical protein